MTGERPVTIAVLGAHSTGKSTFLARLAHELRRHDIAVATVADLGEQAQRIGMPILFNHTWTSTAWIITRGISNELEAWLHADVVLVDRAVPDALGYYRAALDYRDEPAEPAHMSYLDSLVIGHSRHYDRIYRTTLDQAIPLGGRKPRDGDRHFRELADRHIAGVLADLALVHEPLATHQHNAALAEATDFAIATLAD